MSENAIIIRTDCKFQSKALNTATQGLYKAFAAMENGKKDACVILAKVEKNKSYSEDGFKSLAEYAERIGLNKSLAHKMENAGRLLISENDKVKDFADKADFSKLAILSSLGEDTIADSIESGEISPDMTQSKITEAKAAIQAKSAKEKVLPKYHVVGLGSVDFEYEAIELEMIPELEGFVKVGSFDFICGYTEKEGENTEKWTVYASPITGGMVRIKAEKVKVTKKPVVKSAKNMTTEELQAKIAEYQALLAAQESGEK